MTFQCEIEQVFLIIL